MKPSTYALLISCFFCTGLLASINDSLVRFSDLNFRNDFEKSVFKNYQALDKDADIIDLFLGHYNKKESFSSALAHQQIMDCVSFLKKETADMTNEKKVKFIYKYVHKRFFKVYKLYNSFSDVFETGEYNCVSGSAMYAIIFQLMNIPYQVVEAPQHVFLFAYPATHKIAIETTAPQNGYFPFTDAYVAKFIGYLYQSKLITKEEYEGNTPNQLFNKYYFSPKGLNIQELAAIQYVNYAVYYQEDNENEKALEEMKKAYLISPGERNKYILQSLLQQAVSNSNYKQKSDVSNLVVLCRNSSLNKKEVSSEGIRYEFSRLTREQLVAGSNYELYDASYKIIHEAVADSALNSEIAFIYHYELARLGYLNYKDKSYELLHLKEAYDINPKHADLQGIIKVYLARLVDNSNDPVTTIKLIGEFSDRFGFLAADLHYSAVLANCLLELAYQGFMINEISTAENYLSAFESLCTNNRAIQPKEHFVEKAYSTAAAYYYKKGNTAKTRQVLKSGIGYAPDNFGLQMRLSQAR